MSQSRCYYLVGHDGSIISNMVWKPIVANAQVERIQSHTSCMHPYTNVNNKIVLVFSLPGQIDWSESEGMLYIVSRDISSHLKLAMYDNTLEGETA